MPTTCAETGAPSWNGLALTGVAKLDFKRDPHGNLRLLEINPRFNLWHHAGAVAGVNIPALVYADLVGMPRPPVARAKAGVRWCRMWKDLPAARADGMPLTSVAALGAAPAKPSRLCRGTIRCRSCAQHFIAWPAITSDANKPAPGAGKIAAESGVPLHWPTPRFFPQQYAGALNS